MFYFAFFLFALCKCSCRKRLPFYALHVIITEIICHRVGKLNAFVCAPLGLRRRANGCVFVFPLQTLSADDPPLRRTGTPRERTDYENESKIVVRLFHQTTNDLALTASFVGVTSLIFCAKGNPFGQLLMIVFSVIYGIISLRVGY